MANSAAWLRGTLVGLIAVSLGVASWARRVRAEEARQQARLERALERQLLPGLDANQSALTIGELDLMRELDKRPEISEVLYLNKYAEVRWDRDTRTLTMTLPELSQTRPVPRCVVDAGAALVPVAEPGAGKAMDAVAVPLVERGSLLGLVLLRGPADRRRALAEWLEARPVVPPLPRTISPNPSARSDEAERSALQHYLSGVIYYQKGDAARSVDEFKLSLLLSPGFGEAREGLARAKELAR